MSDEQPVGHLGVNGEDTPDAHYIRTGEHSFRTTVFTQGAWSPQEQHMAASSGLLVHEIERNHPREDMIPVLKMLFLPSRFRRWISSVIESKLR